MALEDHQIDAILITETGKSHQMAIGNPHGTTYQTEFKISEILAITGSYLNMG